MNQREREQVRARFRKMHVVGLAMYCRKHTTGDTADVAWDVLHSRLPAESMVRERDTAVARHNDLIKAKWSEVLRD